MIPSAITEAENHILPVGEHAGCPLRALKDDVLLRVVTYYRSRDFIEWRAAYLTATARLLRGMGLLEAPRSHIEAAAQRQDNDGVWARWYLEWFGKELQ